MTDDRSLERAARSWLEVGPTQAPDRAVEAALLRIETTPQERDWHVPWRLPKMTTPARVAAAAVIGVLAIGGALYVLETRSDRRSAGPARRPTPTPHRRLPARRRSTLHRRSDSAVGQVRSRVDRSRSRETVLVLASAWPTAARMHRHDRRRLDPHHVHRPGWLVTISDTRSSDRPTGIAAPDGAGLLFARGGLVVRRSVSATRPGTAGHPGRPDRRRLRRRGRGPSAPRRDDARRRHARWVLREVRRAPGAGGPHRRAEAYLPLGALVSTPRGRASAGTSGSSTSMASASWSRASDLRGTSAQHQAELQAIVDSIQIEP